MPLLPLLPPLERSFFLLPPFFLPEDDEDAPASLSAKCARECKRTFPSNLCPGEAANRNDKDPIPGT